MVISSLLIIPILASLAQGQDHYFYQISDGSFYAYPIYTFPMEVSRRSSQLQTRQGFFQPSEHTTIRQGTTIHPSRPKGTTVLPSLVRATEKEVEIRQSLMNEGELNPIRKSANDETSSSLTTTAKPMRTPPPPTLTTLTTTTKPPTTTKPTTKPTTAKPTTKLAPPTTKTTMNPTTTKPTPPPPTTTTTAKSNTFKYDKAIRFFSQNLLVEIAKERKENFVFSPLSLHIALTMLAHGGTRYSATRVELLQALGFRGKYRLVELESLEKSYSDIFKHYTGPADSLVLALSNGIWTQEEFESKIDKKYLKHLNTTYNAQVLSLPKVSPEVKVNEWVKNVTKGKIEKIVSSISPDTVMMLTNALHFNGSWTATFQDVPELMNFTLSNGTKVQVKMMTRSSYEIVLGSFKFEKVCSEMTMHLVTLSYLTGYGRFQMFIVMPEELQGLDCIVDNLARGDMSEQIFLTIDRAAQKAGLYTQERSLIMPLFSVSSELQVEDYLKKLGVKSAFSDGEFGNIVKDVRLRVSSVNHVAKIDVTLEGTVGAAATGVELVPYSASFYPPEEIIVNKPFLFLIKDTLLDTHIFVGKIENPSQK